MKRRNADCGKIRRPIKRNKISEGFYGSTFVYVKFLMVWAAVLIADFILEFRFEYLWPFWLLLRSVYDSFKYQGLAFSVFFVCVAVTSDVMCYLFIPVQWLFFAASTYVWVQYVWHTDRGICLPTVSLWLLFVYIEASIRLREFKNFPFNLDLCRPFAAHCIGYPVVTLGFGFKSYVSYRFRLRKQKEVQKENEFYFQLLQQALPIEQQLLEKQKARETSCREDAISAQSTGSAASTVVQNGSVTHTTGHTHPSSALQSSDTSHTTNSAGGGGGGGSKKSSANTTSHKNSQDSSSSSSSSSHSNKSSNKNDLKQQQRTSAPPPSQTSEKQNNRDSVGTPLIEELQYIENALPPDSHNHNSNTEKTQKNRHSVNEFRGDMEAENERSGGGGSGNRVLHKQQNGVAGKAGKNTSNTGSGGGNTKENNREQTAPVSGNKKGKNINTQQQPQTTTPNNKDEVICRLESDLRRQRQELSGARTAEHELRSQVNNLLSIERLARDELAKLREDNENLQNKLHKLVTGRQQDKEMVSSLERQLTDERKHRSQVEQQLGAEKKAKKEREAAAAAASALPARNKCYSEKCKLSVQELEADLKQARREMQLREEQIQQLSRETQQMLRKYKDSQSDNELLLSALSAMQDKNVHLENSLSAENRLKQDLFSALGDAKRQIEIQQGLLAQKEFAIASLKVKVAEVMALLPNAHPFGSVMLSGGPHCSDAGLVAFSGSYTPASQGSGSPLQSCHDAFTPPPPYQMVMPPPQGPGGDPAAAVVSSAMLGGVSIASLMASSQAGLPSSLNPMANDYTPKPSQ